MSEFDMNQAIRDIYGISSEQSPNPQSRRPGKPRIRVLCRKCGTYQWSEGAKHRRFLWREWLSMKCVGCERTLRLPCLDRLRKDADRPAQ